AREMEWKLAPAVYLAGRAYAAKGWYLDAVGELRRAVVLDPENVEARVDLGRAYVHVEAWDDALREAAAISAKDASNTWAMYLRAASLNAKQQRPAALASIEQALKANAPPPEFHTVHGDIRTGLKEYGEAERAYRAALAQNPKFAPALVGLGEVLQRQGRADEARRMLEEAKASDPNNASARLALSANYAAAGKLAEALNELESLPRQNWTLRVALVAGQLEVELGKFREAVTVLTRLRDVLPDLPTARYWLGHALLGLDRPDEAVTEFRAAVQKQPDNVLAHMALATGLLGAKQPREALAELTPLARPLQNIPEYHLLVGRAYLALGATDDAIKAGRTTLALRPQEARAWALIGSAYTTKGDLRAGQEAFAKAIEVDPKFTAGRVALGHIYNLEKRPEDALKEYEAALAQNPRDPAAVAAKITTLVQQQRVDEAVATAQAAVKTDPNSPAAHELPG